MNRHAIDTLSARWQASPFEDGVKFRLEDYVIEYCHRSDAQLVVAFEARRKEYPPAWDRPAWGDVFLKRRGVSALHVKPENSNWYRRPELEDFFNSAKEAGLFDRFDDVMTYGGSMGGFGALSFAGLTDANKVLSMNPLVNLGPGVREWEVRFPEALEQDWTAPLCDITTQLQNVEMPVLVYDPLFDMDRRHIEMIELDHLIKLHLPFVGHRIPPQLQNMRMLAPLFDAVLSGTLDEGWYYRNSRRRRTLLMYKRTLRARTRERPLFSQIVETMLPPDEELR